MLYLLLTALLALAPYDELPRSSWAYQALDYLASTGALSILPPSSQPYLRQTCQRLWTQVDLANRKGRQVKFYLDRLHQALASKPLARLSLGPTQLNIRSSLELRANSFSSSYTPQGFLVYPQSNLAELNFEFSLDSTAPLSLYHNSSVIFHTANQPDTWDASGRHYPGTRYKSYTNYFAFQTSVAYLAFPVWFFTAKLGRDYLSLGPGYRSSVILSSDAPTLDQILIKTEQPNYKLLWFVAGLSRWYEYSRFLSGQRGEINLTKHLRLGSTMLVVWSPDSLQTKNALGYLNPLVPLYLEKSITGDDDNVLVDFDLTLYLKNLKLYGALLVDNYEFNTRPDRPPNCYGLTVGLYLPFRDWALRTEYSKITRYTYYHRIYHLAYTHYSVPLGHSLGPDADELYGRLEYYPQEHLRLAWVWLWVRRGDGNLGSVEHKTWDSQESPIRIFPSPPVRKYLTIGFEGIYFPSSRVEFKTGLYYEYREQKFMNFVSLSCF